jgi:hypothetical protein
MPTLEVTVLVTLPLDSQLETSCWLTRDTFSEPGLISTTLLLQAERRTGVS